MDKYSEARLGWWLLAGVLFALPVHGLATAEDAPSISTMLKEGWQIAGYSQATDNRSTFILFRHPDQTYLVQCRAGYDATRTPPTTRSATYSNKQCVWLVEMGAHYCASLIFLLSHSFREMVFPFVAAHESAFGP
jgi:hypothetical protein